MATGVTNFPASLDVAATLLTQVNDCSSLLNGAITDSATSLDVVDASLFPTAGIARVEDEFIKWTGKSTNTLTGLSRGAYSSVAASHATAADVRMTVMGGYHNVLVDAMIAVETKLGSGSDTAAANEVLRGTGSGTSDWGQVTNAYVAAGIDAAKIADGSISNTEFQYLNGASSNIQTQLDSLSGGSSGTFIDTTAVVKGSSDSTKQLRFEVDGFTTATTRVLTPPNYDGTIATLAGSETFTNKTLTASSNVLGGVTMTLGSDADGDIYYRASNVLTRLPKGTALQGLRMNAGATAPEWAAISASATWSSITDPSGNLSLAMGSNLTTLTWAGNYSTSSAFKLAGNNTSATGPLFHLTTATSNLMPPILVEIRGANQRLKVGHLGDVILGQGGIGGTDTDGWVYLPAVGSNAMPSGTPTGQTGFVPVGILNNGANGEYDLCIYANSRWIAVGGARKRYDTVSGNGAQTLDFNQCQGPNVTRVFTASGGNATLTFSNPPPAGSLVTVVIVQDATGTRTITWPASVKWTAGVAPTLTVTASKRDAFVFMWDGSFYYNVSMSLNL